MKSRPDLKVGLKSAEFINYYYLKEELVLFLKDNKLNTTGNKLELTERIKYFLETGRQKDVIQKNKKTKKQKLINEAIVRESIIEHDFVCTEIHRKFFEKEIGEHFSFNVIFQKWLKNNAGKTYQEAILSYKKILQDKKRLKGKSKIDKQFEYNQYIRDFFTDNNDKKLKDAIICWKYKKSLKGNNKYEKSDLIILREN